MPRTPDHIVATHQIARQRVDAGQPVWAHTVDLRDVFHSDTLSFTERRNAIVRILRATQWVKDADRAEMDGLFDIVVELAAAEDVEEFDGWWDELYDLADTDRVWIKTR